MYALVTRPFSSSRVGSGNETTETLAHGTFVYTVVSMNDLSLSLDLITRQILGIDAAVCGYSNTLYIRTSASTLDQ